MATGSIQLSDNARAVLAKRYLIKDDNGQPTETPETMFRRVADVIAQESFKYGSSQQEINELSDEFYRLMTTGLFEPNSPTLMNAGRPLGQLSACYVLGVQDCLSNDKDGIYDSLKSMALIHQSGGGTGFAFSKLRPRGSVVRSTTGVASGPVSFMKMYDTSTEVVKQGGTRRGANMGILRVDHPDIREFISCKRDVTQYTNFNISVAVTDAFMEAYKEGKRYALVDPHTGRVSGTEDARSIMQLIVDHAWATGEPGLFFIDKANAYNPVPHIGSYEATNPCGEQPLLAYDVCNLGSINVGAYVRDGELNWTELQRDVDTAVRFLDNVIDANKFPLPEIHDLAHRIRRIGLGVMGFADALVRMGIPYNSDEGIEFAADLMELINEAATSASEQLADERGAFPEWERSIWGPDETCARDRDGNRIAEERRLRNCNVTTVAPTGTISVIADCSGGIEPLFAVAFMRNQAGMKMPDVNKDFVSTAKAQGWYSGELIQRIAESGHIHFPEVPLEVQRVFVTAHDITPEWHVRMQAAFQRYVHSAISKTCNFPKEATKEDVLKIYEMAYDLDCKGVTVYRDGSRPEQVLSTGATEAKPEVHPEKRPDVIRGETRRINTPLGAAYITINSKEDGKPFELFINLGKNGSAVGSFTEAVGRLTTLALRAGVAAEDVVKHLRGISQEESVGFGPNKVLSVPDAVAQCLEKFSGFSAEDTAVSKKVTLATCPNCKSDLVFMEGCEKCPHCNFSKCG